MVEFYTGQKGQSSFTLENKDGSPAIYEKLEPGVIQAQESLDFPADPKPETGSIGSSVLVCSMAGLQTVNHWAQVPQASNCFCSDQT